MPAVLFVHPSTESDTTARQLGVGKVSILQKKKSKVTLCQCADVFLNEEVIEAGEMAMYIIHGGSPPTTLDRMDSRRARLNPMF